MPHDNRKREIDRRVLPHNISAEASILGGIIIRNEVLALLPNLEVDDFYDMKHKIVFGAIRALEAAQTPIDVVTLEREIERQGKLEAIGGIAFLGELALKVPTAENVEFYTNIVVDCRLRRDLGIRLSEIIEAIYQDEETGEQLIHDTSSMLMRLRTGKDVQITTIGELAMDEYRRATIDIDARARGERVYAGVPTGFVALDERCGGHPIGVMTLYIARPATGKTTFAMSVCKSAKEIADMDSLLCSYEDRGQSFGQRALGQETGIATERIRARKLTREDMADFNEGAHRAARRTEGFMDCAGLTVEQLVRRVRRENLRRQMAGQKPLRQIVVDYIQKMPLPEWARTRDEGVGHISRVLSTFAATDDLAVVAMSQLNREAEKRDDHRPRMSDIRDSGSLEQDGKLILGIYYPYQYEPKDHRQSDVYLLVLKNAQGEALSEIPLYWERATHAIYNSAIDYQHARASRRWRTDDEAPNR